MALGKLAEDIQKKWDEANSFAEMELMRNFEAANEQACDALILSEPKQLKSQRDAQDAYQMVEQSRHELKTLLSRVEYVASSYVFVDMRQAAQSRERQEKRLQSVVQDSLAWQKDAQRFQKIAGEASDEAEYLKMRVAELKQQLSESQAQREVENVIQQDKIKRLEARNEELNRNLHAASRNK